MPALRRGRLGLAVAAAATLLITTTAASAAVITSEDAVALGGAMSAVGVTGGALTVDYDCSGAECPTGIADSAMAGFPTSGPTFGIITSGDAGLADDPNSEGNNGYAWSNEGNPIPGNVGTSRCSGSTCRRRPAAAWPSTSGSSPRSSPEFVTSGSTTPSWRSSTPGTSRSTRQPRRSTHPATSPREQATASPSTRPGRARWTRRRLSARRTTARRCPSWPAPAAAPGSVHSLYLTMFDQGDPILDSAVFVDNIRFENLAPGQCKSLALDPYEATTGVTLAGAPAFAATNTVLNIPVTCGPSRRARSAARSRRPPAS